MRTAGLIVIAAGAASFFLGLFGIPKQGALQVTAGGILILAIGVIVLLFGLRPLHPKAPHISVLVVTVLAIALHVYETCADGVNAFNVGVLVWSLAPYALCLVVAILSKSCIPSIARSVTALLFDVD